MNSADPITPSRGFGADFTARVRAIGKLAVPVTAARTGMLVLIMVDTAMTGYFSSTELAFYSLGHAVHMVCMLIGVGMLVGTAVLCAQAYGAGTFSDCGVIWRVSLIHALALGLLFALLAQGGVFFYQLQGQEAALADGAGRVLAILNLGLPGQLVFTASILFLESLGRPGPGLIITIIANILNIALNWLLIDSPVELLARFTSGGEGAAWATTIVRWLIGLVAVIYILRLRDAERYNVAGGMFRAGEIGRKLRSLGYPLGLAQGLESAAFASLTIFAGHLGTEAVGAFQVVMMLVAFCYMAAIGVGTATAVHVGLAIGRQNHRQMVLSGWAGLFTIAVLMAVMAIVVALFPAPLARIFTQDPVLLALAVPTLFVAAATLISDGAQGVLMGALRGAGDVWVPSVLHLCAFLFVMVPAARGFAFWAGYGTPGLMMGTFCGVTVAALLLAGRFHYIAKHPIDRL
ncbi:MAG: MATE family efflux transporter [Rhodospirillaceae bacterium]|jgi:MATE family multidrug resistance protein|nr:MATE family efflux transporter [Rhodospirillaceae bacterium]MBT4045915.1 MATE family efflux transporter [Rhodospirillaceae bacterium]MBT4687834.1 MATE family efflux transporter [Rhodospirillaceae bacterium]MBT5083755.1 MATE family efflux transporter [Rhodospirillaceae bacterium]MBT5526870.1 MATE family efflux transporter [Rhodospirillaceae bacterium]